MTYTFFDLLKDDFEREVASTNYNEHEVLLANNLLANNLTAYGKALAYAEILQSIGHTVDWEVKEVEGLYKFTMACVDGEDVLEGGLA